MLKRQIYDALFCPKKYYVSNSVKLYKKLSRFIYTN